VPGRDSIRFVYNPDEVGAVAVSKQAFVAAFFQRLRSAALRWDTLGTRLLTGGAKKAVRVLRSEGQKANRAAPYLSATVSQHK
jgi:hypothetical protein